jgi:hypothetical protein
MLFTSIWKILLMKELRIMLEKINMLELIVGKKISIFENNWKKYEFTIQTKKKYHKITYQSTIWI